MEKTENTDIKTYSVESILLENRKLIKECLDISTFISTQLANNSILEETDQQISCIKDDLEYQNRDLTLLLNTLLRVKNDLAGDGD